MSTDRPYPVSDHCDGHRFFNPTPLEPRGMRDVLRWKLTSRSTPWPKKVALQPHAPTPSLPGDIRATWINHSTFLIETPQGNILTDPVYSRYCGPLCRFGPPRVHEPGIAFQNLPEIHYVLLSHDHYDHCDLPTLGKLAQDHDPLAIAPIGNRDLLNRAGLSRTVELDWWQNHALSPTLAFTVTPAQHWSNRLSSPRFSRLWGGFYINAGSARLYFAGDTGYHPGLFKEIGRRLGPPDFAMLPIGAYEPRWFMRDFHCDPAEAVQIHCDLGARKSAAMHWGTFQLTDEGRTEPPRALRNAVVATGLSSNEFQIPEPGETIAVSTYSTCTHSTTTFPATKPAIGQ